jgi:S1-C subfamily serine protease
VWSNAACNCWSPSPPLLSPPLHTQSFLLMPSFVQSSPFTTSQRHDSTSSDAGWSGDIVTHDEIKQRNIPFDSVIKVFVATSKPNYMMPWQTNRQEQCTGSAFVINKVGGKRVMLTNAHVVRDAATVRVRRHGGSEKWVSVSSFCPTSTASARGMSGGARVLLLLCACPSNPSHSLGWLPVSY